MAVRIEPMRRPKKPGQYRKFTRAQRLDGFGEKGLRGIADSSSPAAEAELIG